MADSSTGSRSSDSDGNKIMLADSHTAADTFGLTGGKFLNVPYSKFLFYVKFHRAQSAASAGTGTVWDKGLGMLVKTVDRPRIQFKTETLNQYNRKRVVQTDHDYDSIQLRFYDTNAHIVQFMFAEYFQYYYSNSYMEEGGTSVYDVVTPEGYEIGKWGFRPPLDDSNYGYFFSHITVYQIAGGNYSSFDLINPKLKDYNPDDFDASANGAAEIQMSFDYENIVFYAPQPIPDDMISEMGLDRGQFWDVETPGYDSATYGVGKGDPSGSVGDAILGTLSQNFASLVTGQGTQSVGGMVASVAGQFDQNRNLAVGKTAVTSLKNIVSGNTSEGKQGIQGLLKGSLFGSPGKFF